jgi:ABC-2 type transport system permease protein
MIAVLPNTARNYLEYARIGFVNILAFRLRYFTGIVTYLINVTVYYFIWSALYRTDPEFVQGYSFDDMVTYVSIGWIIRSVYFNNIDQNMSSDVLEGKIALALLKPVSIQTIYLGRALGESAFRLVLLTIPAGLVIFLIFPVKTPPGAAESACFLLSLVLSIFITAGVSFIVGCFAVRLKSILGLLRAKFFVQELLSGLLLPMTMFPERAQAIVAWLPFQHIAYTPLRIYLGKIESAHLGDMLLIQVLWVLVLIVIGRLFWGLMVRKITIQGG